MSSKTHTTTKRKRSAAIYDEQSADTPTELPEPFPKKKKSRNRTEYADPREDCSLNSQSKKALEYAFRQMNKPSKWKFSKARQNWIVRNVWSPEMVPDEYLPLVVKYVSKIQGGTRQKLQDTCTRNLEVQEKVAVAPNDPAEPAPKSILKKTTAGPLIDPTPVEGDATAAAVSPDEKNEILKQRAQTLLEALRETT